MDKDWRLVKQHKYLDGKKLVFTRFVPSELLEHKHCSFCWDKFGKGDNSLEVGYCTSDGKWWVCEQCYKDFKEEFRWQV